MKIDLSPRQQSTIAVAATLLAAIVILCAIAGLLWLIGIFFATFSHVFLPLAVAGIIALVIKPLYDSFVDRLKLPPVAALAVMALAALVPLALVGWFFGAIVVRQSSDLVQKLPELWEQFLAEARQHLPLIQDLWDRYGDRVTEALQDRGGALLSALQYLGGRFASTGGDVFSLFGRLAAWVVLPVYIAFFLLMDPQKPQTWSDSALPFLKPETREDISYLGHEFVNIIVAFFRGQLLIALLQGILFALGFSIVGLRWGAVLGLALGLLNIIPYLGSILGLGVALPLALWQTGGGFPLVVGVLVVFTVVQMVEGYVLTPKIMGDRTGLHPMVIMVAVFFWGSALNGILGMLLAIPLTAFFVVFWRLARDKYFRELV
ncbi:MAG TPA: AI-2E family transporter [Acidobacteriota bacterium]|nr:AI-2E family transporter [Acidobacteriota bacterium]